MDGEAEFGGELHFVEERVGGSDDDVVGDFGCAVNFDLRLSGALKFDVDGVVNGDGLKDGSEFVEPIVAFAENFEGEVDFGQRRDAGMTGCGGHGIGGVWWVSSWVPGDGVSRLELWGIAGNLGSFGNASFRTQDQCDPL